MEPVQEENVLRDYVFSYLFDRIHPKLWAAGAVFALAVWYRLDLGYLLMLANFLGVGHIAFTYLRLGGDGPALRGTMFRFGFYTAVAFLLVTLAFLIGGRQPAIYSGYFLYGLIFIDYLFTFRHVAVKNR